MALLTILQYPDERLHKLARPVSEFDQQLASLVSSMLDTMYEAKGIGLAATQVDVHQRILVMDTSGSHDQPQVVINPEFIWKSPDTLTGEEGCLSLPGIYDSVERHARVKVRAQDLSGAWREIDADELTAVCLQHEMDHINGVLFVDYLSALKRNRIKTKMRKLARA